METSPAAIKVFDFALNGEELLADVKARIIPVLRPDWAIETVKEKELTGGTVNPMRVYYVTEQPESHDAFVVRLFGDMTSRYLGNRENEFVAMQLAHAAGCFPAVLASFQNGIITGLAPGGRLEGWELTDNTEVRAIARKIADYHWVVKMAAPVVDRQGQPTSIPEVRLFDKLRSCLENFNNVSLEPELAQKIKEVATPTDVLIKEVDYLEAHLEDLGLPRAFSHYDLHPGNMMRDKDSGTISIVDYEFAGVNILAYDFAYLFLLLKFYLVGTVTPGETPVPEPLTTEMKEHWTRCYLERMFELHGRDAQDVTSDDLQAWMLSFQVMGVVLNLTNGIMSLMFMPYESTVPYMQIHPGCMQAWFALKDTLPELCKKYRAAKTKCTQLE